MLFFHPCHSVNRNLSLRLYLIPKIICKCTAAILFPPPHLSLSVLSYGLNILGGPVCFYASVQVSPLLAALSSVIPDKLLTPGINDPPTALNNKLTGTQPI